MNLPDYKLRRSAQLSAGLIVLIALCSCKAPEPLSPQEVSDVVLKDSQTLQELTQPVTGPVSLYEAMARATLYNLDHRIKMMESALAQGQLELAKYDMLPTLPDAPRCTLLPRCTR